MLYLTFLLALSGGALVHAVRINRPLSSEEPAWFSEAGKDASQKAASDNVTIASYSDGLCQAMEGLSNTVSPSSQPTVDQVSSQCYLCIKKSRYQRFF